MSIWRRIFKALTPRPYSIHERLRTTTHRMPPPTRPAPLMPECKPPRDDTKAYLLIEDDERPTVLAFSLDRQELEDAALRMCMARYQRDVQSNRNGITPIPLDQTEYRRFYVDPVDRFGA